VDNIEDFNTSELKRVGVTHKGKPPTISRNQGDLQQATLPDGTIVRRRDSLLVNGEIVKCIDTELHFIYETPDTATNKGWGLWCTCGSIAGVTGWRAYSKLSSPSQTGKIVACIRLLATKENTGIGEHADGSHE
jgi:hypothetical protein